MTGSRSVNVKKFSVVIPTRDRPDFLAQAVDSVLQQSFPDLELLIVNDGVTSVTDFGDDRVRVLNNETRGAVPARNLGILEASGSHIAFLDDDDYWTNPSHLEQANAALIDSADFYFSNGAMLYPDGEKRLFSHSADKQSLMRDNTILISTVCYRRGLHLQLGNFDEALPYYWDWDWYLRVAKADFRIAHSSQEAVSIRVHPQNMSGETNRDARQENLNLLIAKHSLKNITLKNHLDFV
jgi:glycosyltransferase involved in cell wall biosynthesis